jgi:hypothetical protein
VRRNLSTVRNGQPVRFAESSFECAPVAIAFTAATWYYDVLPLDAAVSEYAVTLVTVARSASPPLVLGYLGAVLLAFSVVAAILIAAT